MQTGGQFWKCNCGAGAWFSHTVQLQSYNQVRASLCYRKRPRSHPPEPWWQTLGPEGKPWGFPFLSPEGRKTSANKYKQLVRVAAKWSYWWQPSYLMEIHTPPPAASTLKRAEVSAVSLLPWEEWHQSPDPAREHTSGTWKRSSTSQCPEQPVAFLNSGKRDHEMEKLHFSARHWLYKPIIVSEREMGHFISLIIFIIYMPK